jgi:hypothetical protein
VNLLSSLPVVWRFPASQKVRIYKECQGVCPLTLYTRHSIKHSERRPHRLDSRELSFFSSRRNWDSPTPLPQASVLPRNQMGVGGAHSPVGEGLGSQFRRLEKMLSTLPNLCGLLSLCFILCREWRFSPSFQLKYRFLWISKS